jgi:aspartyl-tRNA(Asn)/glutamyl-tRNA(Gln) amidotransferase subunit A
VGDLDPGVGATWSAVAKDLPEIDFPDREHLYAVTTTVILQEAARFHRGFVRIAAERYDPAILSDIQAGLAVTSAEYVDALREKRLLERRIEEAMEGWDAVITPTTACVAPTIESSGSARPSLTRFTRPLSLAGHPVLSVPGPGDGLPVGIQFFGRFGADGDLLGVAAAFEKAWAER